MSNGFYETYGYEAPVPLSDWTYEKYGYEAPSFATVPTPYTPIISSPSSSLNDWINTIGNFIPKVADLIRSVKGQPSVVISEKPLSQATEKPKQTPYPGGINPPVINGQLPAAEKKDYTMLFLLIGGVVFFILIMRR